MIHSIVLIVLCALLSVAGNVSLKSAVSALSLPQGANLLQLSVLVRLLQVPSLYLGLGLYALGAVLWLQVLSLNPLGRAYPILVSLTFVLITVASRVLLGEKTTSGQISGMILILGGIYLISRS